MSPPNPASSYQLEVWIDQYGPGLLPVARAFAAGPVEAEDVLQEVWVIAAMKSHRLPAGVPIGAWLYSVTMNVGRSMLRKMRRREVLRLRWQGRAQVRVDVRSLPNVDKELRRLRLWRAVADLPELQKQVVLLRIVEDMSTRDAARSLNRAEGTIKASLHQAIARLRRVFGEESSFDLDDDRKVG